MAAAVASHWLLDVIVHRPDLTLWGTTPKLGLGIWNFPVPALALELGLVIASALACLHVGAIPAARRGDVFVPVGAGVALLLFLDQRPSPMRFTSPARKGRRDHHPRPRTDHPSAPGSRSRVQSSHGSRISW